MFYAQTNHFENDDKQAKFTLLALVAMALISCMLIVAAVMHA